ncbi:MAG: hypothetical protein AAF573_05820 [Bacteroidota bacterium]
MQQVSTSLTLFLKIFLPSFWIVFFSAFTFAVWQLDLGTFGGIDMGTFRLVLLGFLLLGIGLIYWALIRLKRVEMDNEFVFVTNYFKNARYPWHNIKNIEERDFALFRTIHIVFKKPGIFGGKVTFVASRRKFNAFMKEYPHLFEQFA